MKTILDPEYHARIIADIDNVCAIAGIQQRYLHESKTVHLDTRAAWSRGHNFNSKAAWMVAVGGSSTDNLDALATKREVNALLDDASERGKSTMPIPGCYSGGFKALGMINAMPGISMTCLLCADLYPVRQIELANQWLKAFFPTDSLEIALPVQSIAENHRLQSIAPGTI